MKREIVYSHKSNRTLQSIMWINGRVKQALQTTKKRKENSNSNKCYGYL